MTANYTLFAMDDGWLTRTANPTWEDVEDEVMFDSIDLDQSQVDWVFERRSDALRYLTNGEFGHPGGFAAWDGTGCFMGFITVPTTAEIAKILSEKTPEELLREATWIEAEFLDDVSRCLRIYYSDLKRFIENAVLQGNGLACSFTN
ncbi:hypothetical protein [Microvirga arabica]|uniref:DUF1877 family protein n=1 Tax=Microvirga arabica TaxID=1128671 RepID=A0ABV6YG07_9HYPH|nr:hypothetical protein [Microvirga arabica]MBM1172360.1 hypothetical protein [Microvirga arabica]